MAETLNKEILYLGLIVVILSILTMFFGFFSIKITSESGIVTKGTYRYFFVEQFSANEKGELKYIDSLMYNDLDCEETDDYCEGVVELASSFEVLFTSVLLTIALMMIIKILCLVSLCYEVTRKNSGCLIWIGILIALFSLLSLAAISCFAGLSTYRSVDLLSRGNSQNVFVPYVSMFPIYIIISLLLTMFILSILSLKSIISIYSKPSSVSDSYYRIS